ncbi:hypothetical protein WS105_1326 [Weissella ceti]|uniref:hypothetical protein n=1 Tax=Weissella ceti TaxID=759620 RepID=UPI0004F8B3C7|nr:hypothetical protein [Weissella ceti]AIM64916.1 hypothetical protein WS105_1326 [Weissella ceti]
MTDKELTNEETPQNLAEALEKTERNKYFQWFIQGVSYAGIIFTIWACWQLYKMGAFTDSEVMINLVKGYGIWAPIIFVFIQIIQVVIPIIPGGVTLAAGVMIFGLGGDSFITTLELLLVHLSCSGWDVSME